MADDVRNTTAMVGGTGSLIYYHGGRVYNSPPKPRGPRKRPAKEPWFDKSITPKSDGYLAAAAILAQRNA